MLGQDDRIGREVSTISMQDVKPPAKLTDRQSKVLEVIRNYCAENGYPPSIRELMPVLGVSSLRGVTIHLDALERKGWIRRESTSRSIQILEQPHDDQKSEVPLLGSESSETISLTSQLKNEANEIIAVRVKDDAMQSDHIVAGDIVFIRTSPDPTDGSIVAAQSDGDIIVRRLDSTSGKLIASSVGHERRINSETKILGTAAALVRSYGSTD